MKRKLITFSSDFGVGTQGIGAMEAVAADIAEDARVVHLMHGLPSFDIRAAARTMETVRYLPVGIHVCVCDPGVGTSRRGVAIKVGRGDIFVGPDNGIFGAAVRLLGGVVEAYELTNDRFHHKPVSPLFHGRDIFSPVAAHLATGVPMSELGMAVDPASLITAPYAEARVDGRMIHAEVIQINHFGSIHLNILHEQWDRLGVRLRSDVTIRHSRWSAVARFANTFGEVESGNVVILRDDYGRIEVAINMGRFIESYATSIGDQVLLLVS